MIIFIFWKLFIKAEMFWLNLKKRLIHKALIFLDKMKNKIVFSLLKQKQNENEKKK